MNTEQVRALLRKRFAAPEWALMEEVAPSTGGGTGYADAVAMNLWKSRGYIVFGMEIKISRSDWLRELKKPAKAESVFHYCDGWYVVALPGVIKEGELPVTWGYLEVHGSKIVEKIKAPKLEARPLDRPFLASLMRRGFEQLDQIAEMKQRQAVNEAREKIEERVTEEVRQRTHAHERMKKAVTEWESATGLKFDMYGGPSKDLIKMAQQLDELRRRYSGKRGDGGFGFLAGLADDLVRAADTVRNALTECGVTEQMTAEEEISL